MTGWQAVAPATQDEPGGELQVEEAMLSGHGGVALYARRWSAPAARPPMAAIGLLHGFSEHGEHLGSIVRHLAPRGYVVYALDLRGHGRSAGPRGHIREWAEFRADLGVLCAEMAEREPDLPRFLYGHSMGGLVVLEYALRSPAGLRGIVASGPALSIFLSPRLLRLASELGRLWPRLSVSMMGGGRGVSRDPAVVQHFVADPLLLRRASLRLGGELGRAARWTMEQAHALQVPLLILHGGADRVALPTGSDLFFARVQHPDKARIVYPGGYHRICDDIIRDQVLADLEGWLRAHAGGEPNASTDSAL